MVFKEQVQPDVIILSQVLGLESDRVVNKIIFRILLSMSSSSESKFNFAQYLSESIHEQLVMFCTKYFRYLTWLMHLFVYYNQGEFQHLNKNPSSQSSDLVPIWASIIKKDNAN
jgi:hypothetical protein